METTALCWDTLDGDFLELHRMDGTDARHRLVILHGLEGSVRSHYVGGLFEQARRRGWGADLVVFRSCGSRMNRMPRFYHSGETGDLHFVMQRLRSEFPQARFLMAGVSLGGNVLLKWLGEHGNAAAEYVSGAAAVSVPFDLARSSRRIGRGFSRVYQRVFLKTLVRKAVEIKQRYPNLLRSVDPARVRSMWEFDDRVTAPLHGFRDASDYYSRSSSIVYLQGIRVPTLLLSAVDDPFLPAEVLDEVSEIVRSNASITAEFVPHGGHVGFIAAKGALEPQYYAEDRVGDFLNAAAGGRVSSSG